MIRSAMGVSNHPRLQHALEEVLAQCQAARGGAAPKAGLVFTSNMAWENQAMVQGIQKPYPGMPLFGPYTDGEIAPMRDQSSSLLHNDTIAHLAVRER